MENNKTNPYRHFDIILTLFVALLIISNIAATKLIAIGPFIMDGGAILFPFTYVIGDVIAEVFGLRAAKRAIVVSFIASILAALTFLTVQYLPGAPDYVNQEAFEAVLGFVPRIVIASLIAFLAGQFVNAYILIKMKEKWGEKNLWVRLLGSSVAGQFVDTILFCTIAFFGVLTGWAFLSYVLIGVAYKISMEIILLPVTYRVISYMKQSEQTTHSNDQATLF
jgi:hypothetical protein